MIKFTVAWKTKGTNQELGTMKCKKESWLHAMNAAKKEVKALLPGNEEQKSEALAKLTFYKK